MPDKIGPFPLNTIVCGGCLDVMAQMPDECVELVLTDPPYNASHDSFTVRGVGGGDYTTINETWDLDFDPSLFWPDLLRISRQGILFCSYHIIEQWLALIKKDGVFRQVLHLQKTNPMPSARKYWQFTTQYGLWWAKSPYIFNRQYSGHDILTYSAGHTGIQWHPSTKPLAPMESIIRVHSNPGDLVFDPFLGSGTTAVAAKKLGRRFFGCDISQEYVDMANKRLAKIDGIQLPLLPR